MAARKGDMPRITAIPNVIEGFMCAPKFKKKGKKNIK